MKQIVTWVYCPPVGKKYVHSQTGKDSDTQRIQNLYWRCAACFFASSSAVHDAKNTRHTLLTNVTPPEEIFGVDLHAFFEKHFVDIVLLSDVTCTPDDYYEAWNTQFIVLDAMEAMVPRTADDDVVLILDSDCVFKNPISDELYQTVLDERALLYTMNYPRGYKVNGLTPDEMGEIEIAIEGESQRPNEPFLYQGGEVICLRGDQLRPVVDEGREVYRHCLDLFSQGQNKYNEEAHLLSHVYRGMGYESYSANTMIKRMWTDRSNARNIMGNEDALTIWHLPSEKRIGFRRYFDAVSKDESVYDLSTMFRVSEGIVDKMYSSLRGFARRE